LFAFTRKSTNERGLEPRKKIVKILEIPPLEVRGVVDAVIETIKELLKKQETNTQQRARLLLEVELFSEVLQEEKT
jgi:hypothetical protein